MKTFSQWLSRKWTREESPTLAESFRLTFGTDHGQRVLRHLLDHIYCTVYEGYEPLGAAVHNARRSVVQEILELIDQAEDPHKYRVTEATHAGSR